jgi:hypothetical protein
MQVIARIKKEAAVKAGNEVFGQVRVEVNLAELSEAQRTELCLSLTVTYERVDYYDLWSWDRWGESINRFLPELTAPPDQATVAAILDARIAGREHLDEQKRQAAEDRILAFLEKPAGESLWQAHASLSDDASMIAESYTRYVVSTANLDTSDERVIARIAELQPLADEKTEQARQTARSCLAKKVAEWREKKKKAEAAEEEKAAWIEQHGSEHLKKAHVAGYPATMQYAKERAACDLGGGWVIDFKDTARWGGIEMPSVAALDLEAELEDKGLDVEIISLTAPANVTREEYYNEYDEHFEPREAIVVREFLGTWDVIKEM